MLGVENCIELIPLAQHWSREVTVCSGRHTMTVPKNPESRKIRCPGCRNVTVPKNPKSCKIKCPGCQNVTVPKNPSRVKSGVLDGCEKSDCPEEFQVV